MRLNALTGLRFVAACVIVLHHIPGMFWLPEWYFPAPLHLGVSFFFVLSGFVLQHAYRDKIERVGYRNFFVLRFLRLWPCHIAIIALTFAVVGGQLVDWTASHYTPGQILSAIFLLQAWSLDPRSIYALNAPSWSISVEMFFYALFPLLCRQALRSPWLPIVICAPITLLCLIGIWRYQPAGDINIIIGAAPVARLLEFALGITAYEIWRRRERRGSSLIEFAAFVLVLAALACTNPARFSLLEAGWPIAAAHVANTFPAVAFALLIVACASGRGFLSAALSMPPMIWLGDRSFALYLVHQPVLLVLKHHSPWFLDLAVPVQIAAFVVIVIALSAALYSIVERPGMRLGAYVTTARAQGRAIATPARSEA